MEKVKVGRCPTRDRRAFRDGRNSTAVQGLGSGNKIVPAGGVLISNITEIFIFSGIILF